MNLTWSTTRPFIRWGSALLLMAGSLWPACLATAHYWAAGGPPTPEPYRTWHASWGNVFAAGMLALWALAALGLWFMRPRPRN